MHKRWLGLFLLTSVNAMAAVVDGTGVSVQQAATQGTAAVAKPKPWNITVGLQHSVGSGTFVSNDALQNISDDITQSWLLSGRYKFEAWGHPLALGLNAGMDVTLTEPNSNPPRRVSPQAVFLTLGDSNIYTEKHTEITFYGNARVFFPTTYEDQASNRILSVRGTLGVTRTFGPVDLLYSFGMTRGFYNGDVMTQKSDVTRTSDNLQANLNNGVYEVPNGRGVTLFDLRHSLGVMYHITDSLTLSYFLGYIHSYRQGVVAEQDEFTSINADVGLGDVDTLAPDLSLSYSLPSIPNVPISWQVTAGISAAHPARSRDNKDIMWPLFYNSFGSNRAADNYGSIYLSTTAVY